MAAAGRKSTYTAAEVAALKDRIAKPQEEIDQLKRKLEHMNEVFANAQRARLGQSSEKNTYVLHDQVSLFNEVEKEQLPKAEEPTPETILVEAHQRKKKRSQGGNAEPSSGRGSASGNAGGTVGLRKMRRENETHWQEISAP